MPARRIRWCAQPAPFPRWAHRGRLYFQAARRSAASTAGRYVRGLARRWAGVQAPRGRLGSRRRGPPAPRAAAPRRRHSFLRVFLITFAVLLAARIALPFGVRAWVNRVLGSMENHHGAIDAVRLNLWRGSYEIDGLRLSERDSASDEPLVEMRRLDVAVQWRGLLRGRVVAEATCHHPVLYFERRRAAPGEPTDPGADPRDPDAEQERTKAGTKEPWALHLDQLVPFEVNRFVIRDGEVRYRDTTGDTPVDLYLTDFYLEALNIANVRSKDAPENLFAEIEAAGRPFGTGELELRMRFDPFTDPLRMELDGAVRDVQLTDLNDFLHAYGRADAEAGTFAVYGEFATTDGIVEGYVKTLFDGMKLLRLGEIAGPTDALEAMWEGLLALAVEVLENQPHDRLATKVPLRGTTTATVADLGVTVANLLRNAFFAALGPAIDNSVELEGMEIVTGEGEQRAEPVPAAASRARGTAASAAADGGARR